MLIAKLESTLVDAKNAQRGGSYVCPACGHRVVLHRGTRVQPYFAHRPAAPCTFPGEGETAQHVMGKRQLAAFFADWGAVTLEHVLPTIQQRADCWVAHQPRAIALEFQCSPISREDVAARTQGYRDVGAYPFWLLGKRYAQQRLGWGLIDRFAGWLKGWGLCLLFWDVERQRLRVDHHICQAVTGEYQCQQAWVASLTDLVKGPHRRQWWPEPNLARFRWELDRDLRRSSATLKPLQTAVYLTGHHLAGFPESLVTTRVTPPVFGRGVLLWRIVVAAWLFEHVRFSLATAQRLGEEAFRLVGGVTVAVRFEAPLVVPQALETLLADLVTAHFLQRVPNGWRVMAQPQWAADYTAWLENDEKKLG